jgi:hypothetical protein
VAQDHNIFRKMVLAVNFADFANKEDNKVARSGRNF